MDWYWLTVFCEGAMATAFILVVMVVAVAPLFAWLSRWRYSRRRIPPHGKRRVLPLDDYQQYDVLTHHPCDVFLPEYQPQQQPHSRSSL